MATDRPGTLAVRRPPGFHRLADRSWVDEGGRAVTDPVALARLRTLAVPPAWTNVWASPHPQAPVQATGVDGRGRTQYRYSPNAVAAATRHKFSVLIDFGRALPALRDRVASELEAGSDPDRALSVETVTATAVRLLDRGLFRVGNDRYRRDNHTYGLTTLRRSHLHVDGDVADFDFVGKEHLAHRITVRDRAATRALRLLLDAPGGDDEALFVAMTATGRHRVHSAHVNAYLHRHTGSPATAKIFRTWGATLAAAAVMAGAPPTETGTGSGRRAIGGRAIRTAAALLGDTPAVARSSYIHPAALAPPDPRVLAAVDQAPDPTVHGLLSDAGMHAAVLAVLEEHTDQEETP